MTSTSGSNSTESVEDEFLERYFLGDNGILFKCDPTWGYKEQPGCPEGDKGFAREYLGKFHLLPEYTR